MKIVFFLGTFDFGGAEKHALLLADYYKNQLNWETEVWGWSELDGPIPSMCSDINVKTKDVPKWEYTNFFKRKILEFFYKKALKNTDVVMSFNNKPNIFCAEFLKHTNVKLHVWAQQGIDGYTFPKVTQKNAIDKVRCVISNSQNGADYLISQVGVKPDIIFVVHNGIDTKLYPRDPRKWNKELKLSVPDQFNAVMVANITRLKDHITLIKSWQIVVKTLLERGVKANLYLAGRKDNMYKTSYNLVKENSLEDNVFFLGQVKDVYNLVELMDLTLLSSPSEGLPNAVLEAMLLAKPFVGTNIPGIREAVGKENLQYLVEEKNVEDLAAKILKFAFSKELSKEVGEKNKKWVENNFPIEKLWKDTHEIVMRHLEKNGE
jgi:glycosyltransferase involved in cell wall biosynthesis